MQRTEHVQKRSLNREIDYFKIVKILFSRWYLITGLVLICLLAAHLYLWYTPKTYATSALLKFEEKKPDLSDLINTGNSSQDLVNLQSESFIIQSRSLLLNAIKDLDYRISFYLSGRIRTYDVYPQKPLQIELLKLDTLNFYHDLIAFRPVNRTIFNLTWKVGEHEIKQNFKYNTPVNISSVAFTIKYPGQMNPDAEYLFKFNIPEFFLNRVRNGLRTNEAFKNSNIINLQQTDANPQFATDILNAIMKQYLDYDRNQKSQSATQMIHFINDQLKYLSTEVKGSEASLEKYKQNSKIMDVNTSAGAALDKISDLESQRSLLQIQLIAIDQLKDQIANEKNAVSINLNLEGTIDPLLGILITNLNQLLNEKNALLKVYNSTSQPVKDIEQQLLQVKNAALQNINSSNQRIQKNINYLNTRLAQANQEASTLPTAEKDLIGLHRDFEINEKVYSFLSEKSLETQINRSAILPGATIIEHAQINNAPVSPDDREVYRMAIVLGLLAGITIIVILRVSNPYIYDRGLIENITSIPILGAIRKYNDKLDENNSQVLALSKPRSIFAESVRIIRTSLNFLASDKQSKIICVTSEVAGEGKSFVALNLSSTLALIDKKVLLIGADLRRPKLHHTFGKPNNMGLSNYLINQCGIDDIIQHVEHKNLDFISSGVIPPNPSELLNSERMHSLLNELRERYQIILLDTAPVGLVSDSIPLIRWSDISLFVIRYGKSKYSAASLPEQLVKEHHVSNMVIVLNAFEETLFHTGIYKTKPGYGTQFMDYNKYKNSGYYLDETERVRWWDMRYWFKS
jgi:tyrosine-protein kinase Etk/Wzc